MFSREDDESPPRHRKTGRASKRGSDQPGRRLRVVDDQDALGCACPPGYHEYGAHAPGARTNRSEFPAPPGTYPVEDLAAMSTSAGAMLLGRARVEAETGTARCPHLLITRDVATGVITYNGPFPSGLEALQHAHAFVEKYRDLEPRWDFTLTVAPLPTH